MTYNDYMNIILPGCVDYDQESYTFYVNPDYAYVLKKSDLDPSIVDDYELTWDELHRVIELEKDRMNAGRNMLNRLANDVINIIGKSVDPVMAQQQNELFKNLVEYMKANNAGEAESKDGSASTGITREDNADKISNLFPGMTFEKKKP